MMHWRFLAMSKMPEVGDRAPDFSLPRIPGDVYTLSNLLKGGKVVLTFYVLDFSSG